ncbi:MAG: sigma 54-interacting transcriptional regulator [Desulfomicrobium sp.]|nr:sigma 54-interacting transcriptional regulator [Desulfomicrobium sp.]
MRDEWCRNYNFGEIIGQSDSIMNVFEQIEQVSPLNATVLLLGETDTGKGLVHDPSMPAVPAGGVP